MPDNKSKRGGSDRKKVAAGQKYEVRDLAKKLGVPQVTIHKAISKVGNNQAKVIAEVRKNK